MSSGLSTAFLSTVNGFAVTVSLAFILTVPGTLGGTKVPFFVIFLFPMLSVITDLNYVLLSEFYSVKMYISCLAFLILPILYFLFVLCSVRGKESGKCAYPTMLYNLYPGLHVHHSLWWLRHENGLPLNIYNDAQIRLFGEFDSLLLPKILAVAGLWVGLILLQVVSLLAYLMWLPVAAAFLILWFGVGLVLFQSKTLATRRAWNLWFYMWSGDDEFHKSTQVDLAIFNGSMVAEFLLETLPQLCLQCANNALVNGWGAVAILSLVFSFIMAVVGTYRYVYWGVFRGEPILHIRVLVSMRTLLGIRSEVSDPTLRKSSTSGGRRSSGTDYGEGDVEGGALGGVELLHNSANPLV